MSKFPNRRWLIIPSTEVANIDFNQVLESSADSLRYSIDQSKTFVKYEVNIIEETHTQKIPNPETMGEETITIQAGIYGRPSIYNGIYPEYSYEEILVLLTTEEWVQLTTEEVIS